MGAGVEVPGREGSPRFHTTAGRDAVLTAADLDQGVAVRIVCRTDNPALDCRDVKARVRVAATVQEPATVAPQAATVAASVAEPVAAPAAVEVQPAGAPTIAVAGVRAMPKLFATSGSLSVLCSVSVILSDRAATSARIRRAYSAVSPSVPGRASPLVLGAKNSSRTVPLRVGKNWYVRYWTTPQLFTNPTSGNPVWKLYKASREYVSRSLNLWT